MASKGTIMKLRTLAVSLTAVWSAGALAAGGWPANDAVPLRDVASRMESRYAGDVIAIALDASGDKRAHYHVDLYYPAAGIAKLDVDAATLDIASREQPLPVEGWTSLAGAAALAATQVRGQVISAELDSVQGEAPHYDVDVRVEGDRVARLKVDPLTRQLSWRTPPVVAE